MKTKIILCIGVLIGMLFFLGCEGPEGPAGPAGPVLVINTIDANPFILYPGDLSTITTDYNYSGDSTINFSWETTGGDFIGSTNTAIIQWTAPQTTGFYTLTLTLSDNENEAIGHCTIQVISTSGDIPTDYIAYYPFNGNANDESGNGFNGINNGATLCEDRFGNQNSAYQFDGEDDCITISDYINLDNSSFSISVWINTFDYSESCTFYGNGEGTGGPDSGIRQFGISNDGTIRFHIETVISEFSNTVINVEQWYLITLTCDYNSNIGKFYINNTLDSECDISNIWGYLNTEVSPYIGARAITSDLDRLFNGILDDLRIYPNCLDQSQINALYQENGWD